jgi:hypothetical protein
VGIGVPMLQGIYVWRGKKKNKKKMMMMKKMMEP